MRFIFAIACLLLVPVAVVLSATADAPPIVIERSVDSLGFMKPIPVNVSGFSGEVDAVLKSDLFFMGIHHLPADQAKFLVTGNNRERVEGMLTEKGNRNVLLNRAFTGGTLRSQAHALADAIAAVLTPGVPTIAQTKITFKVETGPGKSEVYIADYDGGGAQAATRDGSIVAQPGWAGRSMLFYCSYKLGTPVIFSHHLTTGSRVPVAKHPGANISPAVSPDGSKLAMVLSKGGNPDLYVSELNGANLRKLTNTPEAESSPCWSPDGQTICYASREGGRTALYAVSPGGGASRRIPTVGAPNATEPDWSPDGKWIAFTTLRGNGFDICIVPSRGGDANTVGSGEDPSWAPNSRALICARGRDHGKRLSLLDVPSQQVKDVARILESNSQPSWAK